MSQVVENLATEAEYLHNKIFRSALAPEVAERYVKANELCFPKLSSAEVQLLAKMVQHELDAEAIEMVLRLRKRHNVLSKKIQILLFLVEVRSTYLERFINFREQKWFVAVGSLLFSTCYALRKYVKGSYQIWRYQLV